MFDEPQDFLRVKEPDDLNLALRPQIEVVACDDPRKKIGHQRPQAESDKGNCDRGENLSTRVADAAHQDMGHQTADQNGGADEKIGAKDAGAASKTCERRTPVRTGKSPAAAEEGSAGKGEFGRFKNGFMLFDDDAENRNEKECGGIGHQSAEVPILCLTSKCLFNGLSLMAASQKPGSVPNAGRTDGKPQNGRQAHGPQFAHKPAEKGGEDGTDPPRQRALFGDDFTGGKGKEPACRVREIDGYNFGEQPTFGGRP